MVWAVRLCTNGYANKLLLFSFAAADRFDLALDYFSPRSINGNESQANLATQVDNDSENLAVVLFTYLRAHSSQPGHRVTCSGHNLRAIDLLLCASVSEQLTDAYIDTVRSLDHEG